MIVVSQPLALAAGLRGMDWPLGRHPGHGSVCDVFSVYHARHYQGNCNSPPVRHWARGGGRALDVRRATNREKIRLGIGMAATCRMMDPPAGNAIIRSYLAQSTHSLTVPSVTVHVPFSHFMSVFDRSPPAETYFFTAA